MLPGFCSFPLENWTVRLQPENEMRAQEYGGEEMDCQREGVTGGMGMARNPGPDPKGD